MIPRILEIQTPGTFLSVSRGHLIVSKDSVEIGTVPIDDIGVVIISTNACSLSTSVIDRLANNGSQLVLCGDDFTPTSVFLPVNSTLLHAERLTLQISASVPLKRRLWAAIVEKKVKNQIAALEESGFLAEALAPLLNKIQSGDKTNIEAQAAQLYWPRIFGPNFRRQRHGTDPNALLNYGYTVLRAAMMRAVVAAGFSTALSLKHSAKENPAALVDDLVEPLRPLVDVLVKRLMTWGIDYVSPESKTELSSVLSIDIVTPVGITTLSTLMQDFVYSLVQSFKQKRVELCNCDLRKTFRRVKRIEVHGSDES